jgi:HEAT repeat protein
MNRSSRWQGLAAVWLAVVSGAAGERVHGDEALEERLQAIEAKLDRALREIEALRGGRGDRPAGDEEILYQGRTVPSWIRDLGDRDQKVQGDAMAALGKLGTDALPALLVALDAKDWVARRNATVVVARLASSAGKTGTEALLRQARDPHEAVRGALRSWVSSSPDGVPVLIAALKDESPHARATAARVLGGIVAEGPRRGDEGEGTPAPAAKAAMPALAEALRDPDPAVRLEAARTLGGLGADAREALPALAALVADPAADVSFEAACAVAQAGPPEDAGPALARLGKALPDPDEARSVRAVRAIARFGPAARDLSPELLALARRASSAFHRFWCIVALSAVDPKCESVPAGEVVPVLLEAILPARDPELQLEAIAALGRLGPLAAEAEGHLQELIDPQNPRPLPRRIAPRAGAPGRRPPASEEVRERAAAALARIRGE